MQAVDALMMRLPELYCLDNSLLKETINLSALCGFITWFSIALSHLRFRLGYVRQGYDLNKLQFRAPLSTAADASCCDNFRHFGLGAAGGGVPGAGWCREMQNLTVW
ncbi:MAG: hypothetical protein ABF805_06775 [Bifidobacterium sp.]|uniref:hypothetical protein n=1 Tax=Bifidobacterium sp. TaxID=41200 RepID=UPI0039EBD2B7